MLPEDIRECKIVVGKKQTLRALQRGLASFVFVADDAAPALTEPIVAWCRENNVPVHRVDTMKDLGEYAGIDVKAVACAVLN